MKTKSRLMLSLLLLVVFSTNAAARGQKHHSSSQRGSMQHSFRGSSFNSSKSNFNRTSYSYYVAGSSLCGLRFATIPKNRVLFLYNDIIYYLSDGIIYSQTDDGEYEVVKPEIGMIIPELPEVNVTKIIIDNKIYFEFDNMIYKQIPTQDGLKYEVIGILEL